MSISKRELDQTIEVIGVERWVPACGGLELPFYVNGVRWQYVYCPQTGKHGYYNLDTDIIFDDPAFHPAFNPDPHKED
jgi:hypothetical protein